MSLSDPNTNLNPEAQHLIDVSEKEERKRRTLLLGLLALLLVLFTVLCLFIRYVLKPAPITEMLPVAIAKSINYPPAFKFSITGISNPMGVGLSADGQRLYVTEGSGERLIKMFDRDGQLIQSFAPPGTTPSNRQPTYIAVNPDGRVFVSDNYNHTIDVFDPNGNFIDAIIGEDLTLSKFVAAHNNGAVPEGTLYFYNNIDKKVYYQLPGQDVKAEPISVSTPWAPLGLHFDSQGNLLVTEISDKGQRVLIFPADTLKGPWLEFKPEIKSFGSPGRGEGQLSFPNSVVKDSKGNFYVSDGNNGRISLWNSDLTYKTFFGFGSSDSSFNLPRGMWIDRKDHLLVADAVGQTIRVFDVSGTTPVFLYNFGDFGISDGELNYPTDICMDNGGRLYIADRENNRVQIWLY
jgi:DNA-binding beta-propeller fold protein YncE